MSFLAHATPKEYAAYPKEANRARLADGGLAKLRDTNHGQKLSTLPPKLNKGGDKYFEQREKIAGVVGREGLPKRARRRGK